jgi:predicted DsbA family dithiol-disulfide isomerase
LRKHQRIAGELELPVAAIRKVVDNGEACAALYLDDQARQKYQVPGSPTLVLNDGRQLLYGNVGYRIIEANVRELMQNPLEGDASWC